MSIFRSRAREAGEAVAETGPAQASAPVGSRRISRGTDQQEALWAELVGGSANVMAEARAGSGKSSSCREAMWRVLEAKPATAIRYAVFNKANADEFRADCPPQADVGTVHSFGFHALKRAFGSRVEKNKTYLILDDTTAGKSLPRYVRKSISMLAAHAKNQKLLPADLKDAGGFDRLRDLMAHFDVNPYGRPGLVVEWAAKVLERAAEWREVVDFDDMIWLPVVHPDAVTFPGCDQLYLDEVQDWNPTQHALIPLLCRAGRVVAVGDRYQAIYAWRGADADSVPNLEALLAAAPGGCRRLPLTITFRCPKSHVRLAQQYVSDIQAHDSNAEGVVGNVAELAGAVQPGDMVICPLNAPLVGAALQLIAQRRRAFVRGRALGDQLLTVVRGCGACRTTGELSAAVEAWRGRELRRLADLEGVDDLIDSTNDRAAGLLAIVAGCQTPADVEPAIDALFSEEARPGAGAVVFSTIHRAKGLEADRVWYLDAVLRAPKAEWEARQQRNLRYVGVTRSKSDLTFVS